MDILITAGLFLCGGAAIATCFWLNYIKALDEGYRRGYDQAQKEQSEKDAAASMARWTAEQQFRSQMDYLKGFPSTDPMITVKPLGFEEVSEA